MRLICHAAVAGLLTLLGTISAVESGGILNEMWTGLPGNELSVLTSSPRFPTRPTSVGVLTSFASPVNAADSYGRRLRGFVIPPVTGAYRFWIAGDDQCELWLSADDTSAAKALIAHTPYWTNPQEWTRFPTQQSVDITLQAGQRYYVEALQKDGDGGDHLAVAWEGPAMARAVIPSAYLTPVVIPVIAGSYEFTTATQVAISATGAGTLHYTIDGSSPTASSPTYTGPFTVTTSTVVKAVLAYGAGALSEVAEQVFVKVGSGTGLTGSYFANEELAGAPVVRLDPTLQFNWGTGSPISGITADHFSARWQGHIETQLMEPYTLTLRADDGVRVWLDGALVINDWTYRQATDRHCTLPPGRHTVTVEYKEGGWHAELGMSWASAHQVRSVVPASQLYPMYGVQGTIPTSSPTSPAYVEVAHQSGATVVATLAGQVVPTQQLDDTARYLNVPLDPAAPVAVDLASGAGEALSGSIIWSPTLVVGHTSQIIRKSDSLLLEFPEAGSVSITNYSGTYMGPIAMGAGQRLPVLFSKAGEFTVRLTVQGVETASIAVTVVTVDLSQTILCEVGFKRPIDVGINPFDAPLTFVGNNQLAVETVAMAQDSASLHITPLRRGTPRLLARIHGAHGPLVAEQAIDEFTIDNAALHSAVVNAQTSIGTVTLVMRPYISGEIFTMTMFAHTATFKGGATSMTIATAGGPSSNGEAPMIQKLDTATNETIGIFRFDLEIPEDESKYCFRLARQQAEEHVDNGAALPSASSLFGIQASLPASTLSLLLGSHSGSGNGPTTNVNGDVCHVLAYASVIFTRATDSSEDEVAKT